MQDDGLIKRASQSASGHILLALVFMSFPLFVTFLWLDIDEGRFTLFRMLYLAAISAIGGTVFALLMWYVVTSPLIKEKGTLDK
jgi:hypothetical protein